MSISRFRKVRLIVFAVIWFIISLINILKLFNNNQAVSIGYLMSRLLPLCACLLVCITVQLILNKTSPNGTRKSNSIINFTLDTIVYIALCAVVIYILTMLFYGLIYLLFELGYAPAPQ